MQAYISESMTRPAVVSRLKQPLANVSDNKSKRAISSQKKENTVPNAACSDTLIHHRLYEQQRSKQNTLLSTDGHSVFPLFSPILHLMKNETL